MSSRKNRFIWLITLLTAVLYGLYLVYIVINPIYVLRGVINGKIAIAWYELEMNGEKLDLPTLDTVRILGFPLYTLGFFSITVGIVGIYVVLRKPSFTQVIMEMNLATSLGGLIYSALAVQLGRLVNLEASHLKIDLAYVNNAGLVNFGRTHVYKLYTETLIEPGPILAVTTFYLVLTFISMSTWFKVMEERSAKAFR